MAMLGCMAEFAVVPAISAVMKIDRAIPPRQGRPGGLWRDMTGAGARCAPAPDRGGIRVQAVSSLSAIQGARLVGARRIIAVDPLESKLEYARHFGATHTVNAKDDQVAAGVRRLSGG